MSQSSTDNNTIARDWHLFNSLKHLTNHWERPGWEAGRRAYYWYLTFDGSTELQRLAARCQNTLAMPALDPVPLTELHMTIDRLGAEHEFEQSQIAAIGDAARSVCRDFPEIDLNIGPLAGSAGAIRFSATPQEPLFELRRLLRQAAISCVPNISFETDEFRPHVGIAYSNSNMPAEPIIRIVESLRHISRAPVSVSQASLVLLERPGRTWRWTLAETVPLAAAAVRSRATITG